MVDKGLCKVSYSKGPRFPSLYFGLCLCHSLGLEAIVTYFIIISKDCEASQRRRLGARLLRTHPSRYTIPSSRGPV